IVSLALFTTGISVTAELCGFSLALLERQDHIACLFLGALLPNLEATSSLCSSILTADLRSQAVLPGSLLSGLGMVTVASIVMLERLSLIALLIGATFKSAAVVSTRLWQVRKYWPERHDWQWSRFRAIATRARPYFSSSLAQMGYDQISIVCLFVVATREEVGWFSAGLVIAG